MLEDIKKLAFDSKFNNEIVDKLGYDLTLNVACNYNLVNKNIESLKSLGINNIETIFLNRTHLFLIPNEVLVKKFSKYNIPVIAGLIKEDYTIIDDLF